MEQSKLNEILENHKHWINEDCEGWQEMRANLYGANLYRANLYRANLYGAYLYGADLRGAENIPFIPYACPDFGMFIGFKKARDNLIVVLEIPEDAKRLSATGRKCRCDKARVLEIQNLDGTKSDKQKPYRSMMRILSTASARLFPSLISAKTDGASAVRESISSLAAKRPLIIKEGYHE